MFKKLDENQYVGCEWRTTIYGKSMIEWSKKGKWLMEHKLFHP